MAYARRNQAEDIRANRAWTADDVADLADIPAKHGDMAFEDTNNHAYVYVDGSGWVNISQANLATVTGTLDETNGGTGQSTYTTGDILYASAANTLSKLAKGTPNMVLQQGASIPFWGDVVTVDALASNSLSTGAITTSGLLTTTNGQINFPATQNASSNANTLDDYEEGTWTPAITFGGGSTGITYTTQVGTYVKIGQFVYVQCNVTLSAKGSSTGVADVTGLPFTTLNSANVFNSFPIGYYQNLSSVSYMVCGLINPNATSLRLQTGGTASTTSLTDANFNNNSQLVFSAMYRANS